MFARNSRSESREASESFGWKSPNTFSCVSSVCAVLRSHSYFAPPEEGLPALDVLDVVGHDAVAAEHLVLRLAEVVAHRAHRPHLGEEARRQREVHGGAAERALALAEWRV